MSGPDIFATLQAPAPPWDPEPAQRPASPVGSGDSTNNSPRAECAKPIGRMPATELSGYAQILAARAAMREDVERVAGQRQARPLSPRVLPTVRERAEGRRRRAWPRRLAWASSGVFAAVAASLFAAVWNEPPRPQHASVDGPYVGRTEAPGWGPAVPLDTGNGEPAIETRIANAFPPLVEAGPEAPPEGTAPWFPASDETWNEPDPLRTAMAAAEEDVEPAHAAETNAWAAGPDDASPVASAAPDAAPPFGSQDATPSVPLVEAAPAPEPPAVIAAAPGPFDGSSLRNAAPETQSAVPADAIEEASPAAPVEAASADAAPSVGIAALAPPPDAALADVAPPTETVALAALAEVASFSVAPPTETALDVAPSEVASVDAALAAGAAALVASGDAALAAAGTVTDMAPAEAGGGSAVAPPPPSPSVQGREAAVAAMAFPAPAARGSTAPRLAGPPPRAARAAETPAPPAADARCRAIILKAQLGEETSNAERSFLRSGCGARR